MGFRIVRCDVVEYVAKLGLKFSTARGPTQPRPNFVTLILADHDGVPVLGTGESAPRGLHLTADPSPLVRPFLDRGAEDLVGQAIESSSREAAIASVRGLVARLEGLGAELAPGIAQPFRGSLAGVETALLDVASRGFGQTLGAFLGGARETIEISAISTPAGTDFASYRERIEKYGRRYPGWRFKGDARREVNIEYLRNLWTLNKAQGGHKHIWIDLNEALTPEQSLEFVAEIADEHAAGRIGGKIIIEQPVNKVEYAALPELQRLADSKSGEGLDLVVMADESLIGMDDWRRLEALGGVRAVNVKVFKAGGLLAGADIVAAVGKFDPDIEIYLGGMLATSDLAGHAIISLAKALPRMDYVTSGPGANVRMSDTPLRFASPDRSILRPQTDTGLGALPDFGLLAAAMYRITSTGADPARAAGGRDKTTPVGKLAGFLASHAAAADGVGKDAPPAEEKPPAPYIAHALAMFREQTPGPAGLAGLMALVDPASDETLSPGGPVTQITAGAIEFATMRKSVKPVWQAPEPVAALIVEEPQDGIVPVRLSSQSPLLPEAGAFYLCLSATVLDDGAAWLFATGGPEGLRLGVNRRWAGGRRRGTVAAPGQVILSIEGANDGLGPKGQSASGFLPLGGPVLIEVLGGEGPLGASLVVDGLEVDRFTLPTSLPQGPSHLLGLPGSASPGRRALHALAMLHRLPTEDERQMLVRWARSRAGLPDPDAVAAAGRAPRIASPTAIALDMDTGLPLLTLGADLPRPPASLVKLMTAAVVMRQIDRIARGLPDSLREVLPVDLSAELEATVEIVKRDLWPGTAAGFQPGDVVTVRDLLFGLALASGNDAGRALARVFGDLMLAADTGAPGADIRDAHQRFIAEMNVQAVAIGLSTGAVFATPIGGGDARLSARDVALTGAHAFSQWRLLETIFGTAAHVAQIQGEKARPHMISHTCPLLSRPDGPLAAKTGTIAGAGACLMTWWEAPGGGRIAIATMGSESRSARFSDHVILRAAVARDWAWDENGARPARQSRAITPPLPSFS